MPESQIKEIILTPLFVRCIMPTPSAHRRSRSGACAFLVAALLSSVGIGLLSAKIQAAATHRQAVDALQRAGAVVLYDFQGHGHGASTQPPSPAWLRRLLGQDFFNRATEVDMEFAGDDVDDRPLQYLTPLTRLKQLNLSSTRITDAGLKTIEGLVNLKGLGLSFTGVTDLGMKHLAALTRLEELALLSTRVTDAGVRHLKGLRRLKRLDLGCTRVTDAGMKDLAPLAQLEELDLIGTQITDAGLAHLKSLHRLRNLYLGATAVTDAGLIHLENLPKLQSLWLQSTKVTPDGVGKLERALPKCGILTSEPLRANNAVQGKARD